MKLYKKVIFFNNFNRKHSFANFLAKTKQYLVKNGVKLDTINLRCGQDLLNAMSEVFRLGKIFWLLIFKMVCH